MATDCVAEARAAQTATPPAVSRMDLENGGPATSMQTLHNPPVDVGGTDGGKKSPIGSAAVLKRWLGTEFDTAYIPHRAQRHHR
jgi:acetyl esterase